MPILLWGKWGHCLSLRQPRHLGPNPGYMVDTQGEGPDLSITAGLPDRNNQVAMLSRLSPRFRPLPASLRTLAKQHTSHFFLKGENAEEADLGSSRQADMPLPTSALLMVRGQAAAHPSIGSRRDRGPPRVAPWLPLAPYLCPWEPSPHPQTPAQPGPQHPQLRLQSQASHRSDDCSFIFRDDTHVWLLS